MTAKAHVQRVVGTGAEEAAPRIGVVGGGQLARMMQEAAIPLGIQLHALVEAADGASGQVIPHSIVGDADDLSGVCGLAANVDVLTVEHEHVPDEILEAAGEFAPVRPGAHALAFAQDKLAMREKMGELGIPVPRWWRVESEDEIAAALADLGGQAVLKTPRDGYDGKGVRVIAVASEARDWLKAGGSLLLEEMIPFEFEVAAVLARRPSGEVACWPVVRTVQQEGACFEVVAPAPGVPPELEAQIQDIAVRIAGALDVVGILAVELFVARSGEGIVRDDDEAASGGELIPYVNELAMRPHNSAHWTIEGADTGQFEQHLRAVLDLPLGSPAPLRDWSVMVNVLGSELEDPREAYPKVMEKYPRAKIHMYGKEVKPRRKIGHVTVVGDNLDEALAQAHGAAAMLRGDVRAGWVG